MSGTEYLEALRRDLAMAEERLTLLSEKAQQLERQIAESRHLVHAYETVLGHKVAEATQPSPERTLFGEPAVNGVEQYTSVPLATTGNRSENMPPRRPEFAEVAVAKAIARLASVSGRPYHANEFAHSIWEVTTTKELSQVKRTLNSTLGREVRKGWLVRVAPNTFARRENAER